MEKSKLTFKVETDQFVICLIFLTSVLSKFVAFHPRIVKRIVMALMHESHFPLFFSFSVSFKNSSPSPQEKVGKLSLLWDKWAESLCSLLLQNIVFFPALTMATSAKKRNSGEAICSRHKRALSAF